MEEKEKNPVKAEVFGELLYRHWNAWRDGMRSHVFVILAEGGKAVDVTPGNYDSPPISLGGHQDYTFSPDGEEICFVRNEDPELRISLGTNNDLFTNTIAGDNLGKITSNRANDNSPHYSPDGHYIAYRAMSRPGFEADKYDLILYDRQNSEDTNLTSPLDRSVGEILWSADSKFLFFTFSTITFISFSISKTSLLPTSKITFTSKSSPRSTSIPMFKVSEIMLPSSEYLEAR